MNDTQCIKNLRTFVIDYCNNSNIHGVKYFTKRFLHWSERLWWAIAVSVSLLLCGLMIYDIWMEWDERPTKFDISEKTHISTIPFPTITICPENKSVKEKLSNSMNKHFKPVGNFTDSEATRFEVLAHICGVLRDSQAKSIKFKNNFTDESIFHVIEDLAPNLEYTIKTCQWQKTKVNCSDYISPIFTEHGLCFTFNNLNFYDTYRDAIHKHNTRLSNNNRNVSLWSMEKGYEKEFIQSEYPVRVFDSGRKGALELVLTSYTRDYDFMCSGLAQGFMLSLSGPSESTVPTYHLLIQLSEDITITMKPKVMTTSEGLRNYKPTQRDCFFNSERQLRFFKSYTQRSCIFECLTNFTQDVCGCVRFFMPRDANSKICGAAKIVCYQQAKLNFAHNGAPAFRRKCNCLPSCSAIEYEGKLDRVRVSKIPNKEEIQGSKTNDPSQQQTRLTIFFEEDYIKTEVRIETFTFGDFLAICGGLLGLFLGVSLLSIIELIYYSTLRLFFIAYWSKSEGNEEQYDQKKFDEIRHEARTGYRNAWINQNRTKFFHLVSDIKTFLIKLCEGSNIHGVRYFFEQRLNWTERSLWFIAFGASLCLCSSMIHNVWMQWIEDPVTFSYAEKPIKLDVIPFPTVTICPEIKTYKSKLDVNAALNSLSNLSDIEITRLNSLAHICPFLPHLIAYKDDFTNESIYSIIQDIAPNVSETFSISFWPKNSENCYKFLSPILTDEGLCFTFNALNSHEIYTDRVAPEIMIVKSNPNTSEWDLDSGYENKSDIRNYPFQPIKEGHINVLMLVLAISVRGIEYQCSGSDRGFKLLLSTPGEMVKTSQNYIRLSTSVQNVIMIVPQLTITSEGLRGYKPNQRQCFYSSDNPLHFFKIYTQTNCETECLSNFTRVECGCVKFSMPRDKQTKICGGAMIKCYKSAQRNFFISERGKIFREKCNCLPSCTSIKYGVTIQRTTFDQATLKKFGLRKDQVISILGLRFDSAPIKMIKRKEIYSLSDCLAICGGLLGLFFGVSFLSIVELIYYSTLRLFWTIKMKRNN